MNSKHFQTLSRITYFVFFAVFLIACNSSMNLPTNTPVPTSTHTPTETIQPSATFTLEPTSTNTPIPRLLLLSPFSSDCTEPTLIRANGAYNGIIPNPYDSGMAPGGSGNNYQGHSDFQRPKGCSDNGVYAPASGYFYWMNDQKIELTLDTGLLLELNPENPPEFTDAITKVYKSKPTINLQIAHIKKARESGNVIAGELIGYLTFEAGVPMVSYQIEIRPANGKATIWSPALFQWVNQPICLEHCEAKLNNYYKP